MTIVLNPEQIVRIIFQNINVFTLTVTIVVAVFGWIFALWLQHRNTKQQHRIQIRYDIYKQFVQLHKDIQNALSKLGAEARPPFILMESSMIPFELKLNKEYKGQWIPHSEQECVFKGEQEWTSFVQGLLNDYSEFSNNFIKILYITEDWAAAFKPLLSTKEVLYKEVERLKEHVHIQLTTLQMYTSKHGHDWRKWDRGEVEKITASVSENTMTIGSYLSDFMVLIHNELLASYFGYKRPTRKTLDTKFKVLAKDGIVENVDWEMLERMKVWKEQLISYAKEKLQKFGDQSSNSMSTEYATFLRSVASGICPNCHTSILVMEAEKAEDNFCFRYACGHSWKGVSLKETLELKESLKIQSVRDGFGLVRKMTQGWRPSGDPRLKHGVDFFMDVNREKDEYHQIVKDHKTKKVLHEEHEPLSDHKQKEK